MKIPISVYVTIIIVIVLIAVIFFNVFSSVSLPTIENITKGIAEKAWTNKTVQEYSIDLKDYEKTNVSIVLTNVRIASECRMISFDVTDDQAYSIGLAYEGKPSERPLTHDIFLDALDNFGINVLAGQITDYKDGIYYAKLVMKQGNNVLELDTRPSDTIALLLRLKMPLYVEKSLLQNSTYIC
jgi:bifunctional DNase/RNase